MEHNEFSSSASTVHILPGQRFDHIENTIITTSSVERMLDSFTEYLCHDLSSNPTEIHSSDAAFFPLLCNSSLRSAVALQDDSTRIKWIEKDSSHDVVTISYDESLRQVSNSVLHEEVNIQDIWNEWTEN